MQKKAGLTIAGGGVGVLAIVLGGFLFLFAQPAPAKPTINWDPAKIDEWIIPGQPVTKTVRFTALRALSDVALEVVPALEPYVEISPVSFAAIAAHETVDVDITVTIPEYDALTTLNGTIHLLFQEKNKTINKPLPVFIGNGTLQYVVDANSGASFLIPADRTTTQKGEFLLVGTATQGVVGLPPTYYVEIFDVLEEFADFPREEALRRVALHHLIQEDVVSESFHGGGLEIVATTMEGNHFFIYDPVAHKAAGFASGYEDFFKSPEFLVVLDSLSF